MASKLIRPYPCNFWMCNAIEEMFNARAHDRISSLNMPANSIDPMEAQRACSALPLEGGEGGSRWQHRVKFRNVNFVMFVGKFQCFFFPLILIPNLAAPPCILPVLRYSTLASLPKRETEGVFSFFVCNKELLHIYYRNLYYKNVTSLNHASCNKKAVKFQIRAAPSLFLFYYQIIQWRRLPSN